MDEVTIRRIFAFLASCLLYFSFSPWLPFALATPGRSMSFHLLHVVSLFFNISIFFFDGASDVNVLAFMCSELMGQWSWGAVLACKSLFPSSFIILSMHHHVV